MTSLAPWYTSVLVFWFTVTLGSPSKNLTAYWDPCPEGRSTFDGIFVDSDGGKHPRCVCNHGFFGEKCSYIDQSIHPFKSFRVQRYPNGSTIIHWQHVGLLKYYALCFRAVRAPRVDSDWKPLVNIKPTNSIGHHNLSSSYSHFVEDFASSVTYEINIAIVGSAGKILASTSIFSDHLNGPDRNEEPLREVWYSPTITWSDWGSWGKCETKKGCGKGHQRRTRLLTGYCINDKTDETRACKLKHCPVNGRWSAWSPWSQCSGSCTSATRSRTRTCTDPSPKYGGANCVGKSNRNVFCKRKVCGSNQDIQRKESQGLTTVSFTSFAVGACFGVVVCLLMVSCPRLLKNCKRTRKWDYARISSTDPAVLASSRAPIPPPPPPPPPLFPCAPSGPRGAQPPTGIPQFIPPKNNVQKGKKWKTTSAAAASTNKQKQTSSDDDHFLRELSRAFRTFNVLRSNTSTKSTSPASRDGQRTEKPG